MRPSSRVARFAALVLTGSVLLVALVPGPGDAVAATARHATRDVLSGGEAVVLGIVEGVTEFVPISSTGHLLVTSRLLGLPSSGKAGDAVKSYEIAIQFGAILAVLFLYRHRVAVMLEGLAGRSDPGRRLLVAVLVAFVPAAAVGLVSEKVVKDVLFGVWPVVVAWVIGGVVILVLTAMGKLQPCGGRPIESVTIRDAVIVGASQVLALWPGTSRSLATIVPALLLGLSMAAAVEFSFLLGFVTLGAATAYESLKDGRLMVDTFGIATPVLGLVAAFVAAALSIRWMVAYLTRHDLSVFGWYRIAVAVAVVVLVVTSTI